MVLLEKLNRFTKHHKTALALGGSLAVITIPLAYNFASAGSPQNTSHNDSTPTITTSQSSAESQTNNDQNNSTAGNSATSGQATNQSQTQTNVTVNGQSIDVPANGQVHQTVTDSNGQTHVDINSQQSTTNGGAHSSSSLNVSTHTQSSSESEVGQ